MPKSPQKSAETLSRSDQTLSQSRDIPLWVGIVALLAALLLAAGGIIARVNPSMLVSPGDDINAAVRIYAGYLTSRNLVLALMLLSALALRAKGALSTLMLFAAFIQMADAGIDGAEGRWLIIPGPLVLGAVFFFAAARLSGYPFWRREAWADRPGA